MAAPSIVWFRQDLRIADQRALAVAAAAGPVIPTYVLDDETPGDWRIGGAQRWWLHHSLAELARALERLGAPLLLLRGRASITLAALAEATGASTVHALAHYEPWAKVQQDEVAARLELQLHPGVTLAPPETVRTGGGGRYKIFTPFWRALQEQMPPPAPLPAPSRLTPAPTPPGDRLDAWNLLPTRPNWAAEFADHWTPGETAAHGALDRFLEVAHDYATGRNRPSERATSRLSAHLHHGEISPAQVWHGTCAAAGEAAEPFLREVGWRDFATGLIDQFPDYHLRPYRDHFAGFPFRDAPQDLAAWQQGRTGYPIVDAGLRQLWRSGWMHNRVRMIAGSFLTKHLLIDWRQGEHWFWDTLVDADLGNNALGWQWIMGSGVDSSPFARIFNPVSQGEKHDPQGAYIGRWVPELAALPDAHIHAPWKAPARVLEAAGVRLGETYPHPIVAHAPARARALEAYRSAKRSTR